jgi:serine/threonine-protein kinase
MSERLGPYTLEKRIGSGGMADVFLARGPSGVCVVKRPHQPLTSSPEFVRMFLDEAATLAQLHHSGIAQISDLGQIDGTFYLAMEYVPGFDLMAISLEHERQGELIAPELCARIVADAAAALHFAHEARDPNGQPLHLIHRDISPHNILLSSTGVVKLIDFGVARTAAALHRTQAGLVKGKYPYMAPEQLLGQTIDRRVDIYALGLVLYELLTNVRAIPGKTELEQIDNARAPRIRPIEQIRGNTPVPLRQIIESCIRVDPAGRYPTALALKEDLEKYLVYEHHVVGQEDLLRMFRVIAAEMDAPPSDEPLALVDKPATTEREQPVPALVLPEGSDVVEAEPPGSVSPTRPAIQTLQQHPPAATSGQAPTIALRNVAAENGAMDVDEADAAELLRGSTRRSALFAAMGGLFIVAAVLFAAYFEPKDEPPAKATAAAPSAAAPSVAAIPNDSAPPQPVPAQPLPVAQGFKPAQPDVAGEVQPSEVGRAAVVEVTSNPSVEVMIGNSKLGRSPGRFELAAGAQSLVLVNSDEHLKRTIPMNLKAGEQRTITLRRGVLEIDVLPFAEIRINKDVISTGLSYKQIELFEGPYTLDLVLAAPDLPSPIAKKVNVDVKADQTVRVTVNMMEGAQLPAP